MESLKNKLSKIKIFVTDIDGTIKLNHDEILVTSTNISLKSSSIDNRIIYGIHGLKSKGLIFGIATGRPRKEVHSYLKIEADFIIAENGGVVEIGPRTYFPNAIYNINWESKLNEKERISQEHESIPYTIKPLKINTECKVCYFHAIENYDEFRENCDKIAKQDWIVDIFDDRENGFMSVDYSLPIFDKRHGLEYYLTETGKKPEEVLYFGDAYNDLEIFKWDKIGLKVAPQNACPEVLELADLIVEPPPKGAIKLIKKLKKI